MEPKPQFAVIARPKKVMIGGVGVSSFRKIGCEIFEAGLVNFEVQHGHRSLFASPTDPEIKLLFVGELYGQSSASTPQYVIDAYRKAGAGFVGTLNGSFCFVLIDLRDGSLLAATDRLNSKKLFISKNAEGIAFSSDLRSHPLVDRALDVAAVAGYLANGAMLCNRTPYRNIETMARAAIYSFDGDRENLRTYWHYHFTNEYASKPPQELREELKALLINAVAIRNPTHSCPLVSLSAGYDSMAILGIMKRYLKLSDVRCFSFSHGKVSSTSDEYISREVATQFGYPFSVVSSFSGNLNRVVERNARRGQGVSHFCHEVDGWFEIEQSEAGIEEGRLFVGDECFGWKDRPMNSMEDVLQAVSIRDFSGLGWLASHAGKEMVATCGELVRQDIATIVARCPESRDLHDAKDFLYLDHRLNHVIMPWRENFSGHLFPVENPLLDNSILDFIQKTPSAQRRGKKLFIETATDMLPELFNKRRARSSSFAAYWEKRLETDKLSLSPLLREKKSLLDTLLSPDVLLQILNSYRNHEPQSKLSDLPRNAINYFLHGTKLWDAMVSKKPLSPLGQVAVEQFLHRSLVLRTALIENQPSEE